MVSLHSKPRSKSEARVEKKSKLMQVIRNAKTWHASNHDHENDSDSRHSSWSGMEHDLGEQKSSIGSHLSALGSNALYAAHSMGTGIGALGRMAGNASHAILNTASGAVQMGAQMIQASQNVGMPSSSQYPMQDPSTQQAYQA